VTKGWVTYKCLLRPRRSQAEKRWEAKRVGEDLVRQVKSVVVDTRRNVEIWSWGVPSLIDFGRRKQAECNQPRFVEKSREEGRKTKTKTCLCDECPKERSVSGAAGGLLLYSNRASECNQPSASFASFSRPRIIEFPLLRVIECPLLH
jgi:hypothetical protein